MVLPSLFVTLLALAASPLAAIAAKSIQPPAELARARPARAINSRDSIAAERMTNAKRMSQGLPPLPPRMHRRGSPTAVQKPKPSPSSVPGHTANGYILATDSRTGKFIGFLGKQYELFGEYGAVISNKNALKVSISGVKRGKTGPVEIHQKNGDKLFTSVGAVSGFASDSPALSPGSSNYVYISGTSSTAALAAPAEVDNAFTEATSQVESAESAIWYLDSRTNKLSAQWVNPGGALAKTQLAYYPDDNVFIAVGDINAFKTDFGKAIPVTFTLVGH